MSLSSTYEVTKSVDIYLTDDTNFTLYIDMPLDTIIANYPCDEDKVILFSEAEQSKFHKEYIDKYIREWINRNMNPDAIRDIDYWGYDE